MAKIVRLGTNGKRQISKDGGVTWTCESYKSEFNGVTYPYIHFDEWKDKAFDELIKALEWCDYLGQRCQVLSKNFQDGTAQLGCRDATGPYTLIVKLADIVIENPRNGNKCSCGMSSLRESEQGNHADYCDKYYNPWKG